jgi:hypothetical protein
MNYKMKLISYFCFAPIIIISGCAGASKTFIGNKVTTGPIIVIDKNVQDSGTWSTFDVAVDYQYKKVGNLFEISGQCTLGEHYQMMYERVKDLRVFLFLLDADSRVLLAVPVARSLSGDLDEKLKFSNSLQQPMGMVAISFGYDGDIFADRGSTSFFNLPLSK